MVLNRLRTLLAEGRAALDGWPSIGDAFAAEIVAAQGYDSLTVDLHPARHDRPRGRARHAAGRAGERRDTDGARALARPDPRHAGARHGRPRDHLPHCGGARLRKPAWAAELASCVRDPPAGTRGFGPTRAAVVEGPGCGDEADAQVSCFAMIETARAFADVEAIAATPGLDGLFIGPADLTLGLTGRRDRAGFDCEDPERVAAISRIVDASRAAGLRAALHRGSPASATKAVALGFDLVTPPNDARILARGAAGDVLATRALLRAQGGEGSSVGA